MRRDPTWLWQSTFLRWLSFLFVAAIPVVYLLGKYGPSRTFWGLSGLFAYAASFAFWGILWTVGHWVLRALMIGTGIVGVVWLLVASNTVLSDFMSRSRGPVSDAELATFLPGLMLLSWPNQGAPFLMVWSFSCAGGKVTPVKDLRESAH